MAVLSGWHRLEDRLPEAWARKLADRLEQLERTKAGAKIELTVNVSNGQVVDLRWDPDERIPLTMGRPEG